MQIAPLFASMVESPLLFAECWSVAPTDRRQPDAGDFVHLDGILSSTKLEPDSPILLRTYGKPMQYVRNDTVIPEKFTEFFEYLKASMSGDEQVIPPEVSDLRDPNGPRALSVLKPGTRFETIEEGNLIAFRTGRSHGLYHRAPWPAGWRLNFRWSVPRR